MAEPRWRRPITVCLSCWRKENGYDADPGPPVFLKQTCERCRRTTTQGLRSPR